MKKIVIVISALFLGLGLFAQYGNEWIDYNKTYYKITLKNDKLYRIPFATLAEKNVPLDNAANLKLMHKGQEIPIYSSTTEELLPGDYLEFYGKKNDGTFDSQLFEEPDWQITDKNSLFTDTAAYFLVYDDSAPGLRYSDLTNNLNDTPPKKEFFEYTYNRILDQGFFDGEPTTRSLAGLNSYSSNFGNSEGFLSTIIDVGVDTDFSMPTVGIYDNGGNATIEVKMIGRSNDLYYVAGDHHVRIRFNDVLQIDDYYEGYNTEVFTFDIPASSMSFVNLLNVQTVGDIYNPEYSDASIDRNSLGYIFATYPRSFDMGNISILDFELTNDEDHYLEFENFNGGNSPVLYDVTNNIRIVPLLENGVYKVFLPQVPNGAEKRNLVVSSTTTAAALDEISDMTLKQFVNYSSPSLAADYIILTHPRLMETFDGANQVQRYRDYRASEAGGGYTPLVVDINELYDQFSFGIKKTPLAIRFFVNHIIDQFEDGNWDKKPELLFLLGKSIRYNRCTNSPSNFADNLVPTYGTNGSDVLLSARNTSTYQYQMGTGRVSAKTPEEVSVYLDKIIDYEQVLNTDYPCTVEDRSWLKDVLHIAAGENAGQEEEFTSHLNGYQETIESVKFGGNVVATLSSGNNAITIAPVETYVNNGLNHITFVGHSNGTFWQYGLADPVDYDNEGKYLFVLSSSCFVGDIHKPFPANEADIIMAENFTLSNKGSVGFMAAVKFGFPIHLDNFTTALHNNFTGDLYGKPFSLSMKQASLDLASLETIGEQITSEEMTFCGDPALELYHFDQPEYILAEENISFTPQLISAGTDSVVVNVTILNMGKAVSDSIDIKIEQTFPDGTIGNITVEKVASPSYEETFYIKIPLATIENQEPIGLNQFRVSIDGENVVTEDCEDNNVITKSQLILPTSAYPIAPCDFAIVGQSDVVLKAATALPVLDNQTYLFQIDTTELFNSSLLEQSAVESTGGIINWDPTIVFQNNITYYWRVTVIPLTGQDYTWRNSSFTFMNGAENGWNQSHYYQFASNDFDNCYLDEDNREFSFFSETRTVTCTNTRINGSGDANMVIYRKNNSIQLQASCLYEGGNVDCRGGVHIVAIDPIDFEEKRSFQVDAGAIPDNELKNCDEFGQFGNIHCTQASKPGFQFHIETQGEVDNLMTLLDSIPDGFYILAYSINTHNLTNNPDADLVPVHNFFEGMGIDDFNTIAEDEVFIAFGRKNQPNYNQIQFVTTTDSDEVLEIDLSIDLNALEGNFRTKKIGPSLSWDRLQWDSETLIGEFDDEITVDVYGIEVNGNAQLILNTGDVTEWDLSDVNADQYPQLLLIAEIGDSVNATAPQLQHWRVYYEPAPEFVFNEKEGYTFYDDTMRIGETGIFEMAVSNVSGSEGDSLLVAFTTINNQNVSNTEYASYPPIVGGETNLIRYEFSTEGLIGSNFLQIVLNADRDQTEKLSFNNVMVLPFYITGDEVNPYLDVTFDGVHIMNGDIVAAQPEITIQVTDENLFAPLNAANMEVVLVYPDGQETLLDLDAGDATVTVPTTAEAAAGDNVLTVSVRPEFLQNGTHQLKVIARDLAGNEAGKYEYIIAFEIIREAMITNVLNYPNPFTTSTKFIFTLTGTEVPENLKIQVMTVGGTVVREMLREELGPVHIGKNITEFAWDGTDTFGNELANGVYFYRVVAQQDGEDLELFTNSEDGRFNMSSTGKMDATFSKHGIGKMYKMR